MAKPGDELIDAEGGKIIFKQTAESTNGQLLELEAVYPPESDLPPEHYHPYQEERFEVLEGEIRVVLNGVESTYKPGQEFTIPPGSPHAMHNVSSEEGRLNWQTRPAMKTEFFHETIRSLLSGEEGSGEQRPGMLQLAVIFWEYRREFRLRKPPYLVQLFLFGTLAPIGRLKGYKGYIAADSA